MHLNINTIKKPNNYVNVKSGDRYGMLTIVSEAESTYDNRGRRLRYFNTICDCGNSKIGNLNYIRSGRLKSCGIKHNKGNYKHGGRRSPEYNIWTLMLKRCNNKNDLAYKNYGGRGIAVGFSSFEEFISEVGCRPSKDYSIDRIDNDLGYISGNVKWSTRDEQANNKRSNIMFTIGDETLCIEKWCKKLGIKRGTFTTRIKLGWDVERALTTPVRGKKIEHIAL
jgi:hypothetical protein